MFWEKFNTLSESASIGEELMQGSPLSELDRKCLVVKQVVQDGDFSLEEALELYKVSRVDFENFMAKYLISVLQSSIDPFTPDRLKMMISIEVFIEMYKRLFIRIDKDAVSILEHFDSLSKNVEEGKVLV